MLKQQQYAGGDEQGRDKHAEGDLLVQEHEGEHDGNHDAEFVYRRHARDVPQLQRLEIEEPTQPRGDAGQDEKEPRVPAYRTDFLRFVPEEDDAPCEEQDDRCADGGRKVGVDILQPDFGKNGCQCGKNRRQDSIPAPHNISVYEFSLYTTEPDA